MQFSLKRKLPLFIIGMLLAPMLMPYMTLANSFDANEDRYDKNYEILLNNSKQDAAVEQSPTGAYLYSMPIVVPPGRNGLQPRLSLSYNSQNTDRGSLFGYGWNLAIPSISRMNHSGIDQLYINEHFETTMSGELLDVNLVDSVHGEYAARVENGEFLTYEYDVAGYWTATDKSGTVYTYGSSAGTRQDDPSDATKVYQWMLEEIRDTNGNYMTYSYVKDQGQIYPDTITYTGHDTTDGIFEVQFLTELRGDTSQSYATQFEVVTDYRVSAIEVRVNGDLVRSYELNYIKPDNMELSLLNSVTESAQNENGSGLVELPDTIFSYGSEAKSWTLDSNYNVPEYFYKDGDNEWKGVELTDVNGDGLVDFINSGQYGGITERVHINDGDGTGWTQVFNFNLPVQFWGNGGTYMNNGRLAEVNGDMKPDIILSFSDSNTFEEVYTNDGDNANWSLESYLPPLLFNNGYTEDKGVRLIDVNGDGLDDFVKSYKGGQEEKEVYINNGDGTGWTEAFGYNIPIIFTDHSGADSQNGVEIADVNGDGLADLVQSVDIGGANDTYEVYLNHGDGTGWHLDSNYSIPVPFWSYGGIRMKVVRMADINGDGLPDLVQAGGSVTTSVFINNGDGTGWTEDTNYSLPSMSFNDGEGEPHGTNLMDANGDGAIDIVESDHHAGNTDVYLSNNVDTYLLNTVTNGRGGTTTVSYDNSPNSNNPELPLNLKIVSSVTKDDGLGHVSTNTYEFSDGSFYYANERDKKLGGFGEITITQDDGRSSKTYYHQGNGTNSALGEFDDHYSKIGKPYRTEVYDGSGNLYQVSINKWESSPIDLAGERNFVYRSKNVTLNYDGNGDHRDTAETFVYEDRNGNLLNTTQWGEVYASNDGSFSDLPGDQITLQLSYAEDSSGVIQNAKSEEIWKNGLGVEVMKTRTYYDNLPYEEVSVGNVTQTSSWLDNEARWVDTEMIVNTYGLVTSVTDPEGGVTSFTYDAANLYPEVVTNDLGHSSTSTYHYPSGQVLSQTGPNGFTTTSTYDGLGRVLSTSVPNPSNGNTTLLSSTTYNDSSFPNSFISASTVGGVTMESRMYLDGFGRAIQSWSSAENNKYNVVDTWYDDYGNVEQQSLPYSSTNTSWTGRDLNAEALTYTYDVLGRNLTETSPVGSRSNSYDQWAVSTTDANGNIKEYEYDALGRLKEVTEHEGANAYSTQYEFDLAGNLLYILDSQGNERSFDYDSLGRRTFAEELHASGSPSGAYTYSYDDNNNLVLQTDPKSQEIAWTYDALNRVTTEDWNNDSSADVTYTYDSASNGIGRLAEIAMASVETAYSYDPQGNVKIETKTIDNVTYQTKFNHDLMGRISQLSYPSSALKVYTNYNETGQVEKVKKTSSVNYVSDIDYSPAGQVSYIHYGNDTATTNTYNAANNYRLSRKVTTGGYGGVIGTIQDLGYSYDAVGNIVKIVDKSITPTAKTVDYTYDDLHRLLTATSTGLAQGDYSHSYTYDSVGNMLSKDSIPMTYAGTGTTHPHAVTDVDGTTYTYDLNGNLTNDGSQSYVWSIKDELESSGDLSFTYDQSGQRVMSSNSNTGDETVYVNQYMEVRNGTPVYYIYAGGMRVASLKGTDLTTFHQDHLGGVALATDASKAVTQVYDYHPFGSELINTQLGSTEVHHSYTDKEYDDDLGLYYFEARYQNPNLGKFVSVDPLTRDGRIMQVLDDPQAFNAYAYSRNNPINYVDPDGEFAQLALSWVCGPGCFALAVGATLLIAVVTTVSIADPPQVPPITIFPPYQDETPHHTGGNNQPEASQPYINVPVEVDNSPLIFVPPTAEDLNTSYLTADNVFGGNFIRESRYVIQWGKSGGYEQALKDFYDYIGSAEVDTRMTPVGEIRIAELEDGTWVNVREFGAGNVATIEIQKQDDTKNEKTRYSSDN